MGTDVGGAKLTSAGSVSAVVGVVAFLITFVEVQVTNAKTRTNDATAIANVFSFACCEQKLAGRFFTGLLCCLWL